jgi:hypothetical protein
MDWTLWMTLVGALGLAIAMAVVAWRLLRGDRQRTDARSAMLRQLAFEPETAPQEAEPEQRWQDATMPPPVFATVSRTEAPSRSWVAVLVAVLFVALGAGTVYGLYGPIATRVAQNNSSPAPERSARPADAPPLELLSLSHRLEESDFVVTGLVQNPRDGQPAPPVMAVVYVFNAQGDYFASGKAALEFATLAPGAESPFVVRLPKVSGVNRFRVGFRSVDGAVVAHVDRRGQPIEGTTAGAAPVADGR